MIVAIGVQIMKRLLQVSSIVSDSYEKNAFCRLEHCFEILKLTKGALAMLENTC